MIGDIIETARNELRANVSLYLLVGDGERIYPTKAPQGTAVPYVVLTCVSDVPYNSMDSTPRASRLSAQRLQVDCYAQTYEAAKTLANLADDALGGLARPEIVAERDSTEHMLEDDTGLHRVSSDYTVHLQ